MAEVADPHQTLRLLGLAFAGADLLFEIDAAGAVTFALGAAERLTGLTDQELTGRSWSELVGPDDADLLAALLGGLKAGERQGPLRVSLASRGKGRLARFASLSVCRLPQQPSRVSCALSLGAPGGMDQAPVAGGLMNREAFTEAATQLLAEADRGGLPLRLDLIEMTGLQAKLATLAPEAAEQSRRQFAATLRAESYAGLGGAEIAEDRYALVRSANASSARLAERLGQSTGLDIMPQIAQAAFSADSAAQNVLAMRYALDRYIEDGPAAAAQGFQATVERTVRDTTRFKSIMSSGAFQLAYQPVVSLKDRSLHHFEALARFDDKASPADTIRLAEELELITEFDLSVVKCVSRALRACGRETRIAANLSAHSLVNPAFIDDLLAVTASDPGQRSRLLLEITETRQIEDLEKANKALAVLRKAGHEVCLDDFGAGAASLDYLRKLDFDTVKIDGRYIQGMVAGSRDAVVVKHIVALCAELGVTTIAEMIETEEGAGLSADLGVDLGQGWVFSRPLPEPRWKPPAPVQASAPIVARRAGAREEWG